MKLVKIFIAIMLGLILSSCGGGSGATSSNLSNCSQTPTFGSSTFGNSCFK